MAITRILHNIFNAPFKNIHWSKTNKQTNKNKLTKSKTYQSYNFILQLLYLEKKKKKRNPGYYFMQVYASADELHDEQVKK